MVGQARAHGGSADLVHACYDAATGGMRWIDPRGACLASEKPLDWSAGRVLRSPNGAYSLVVGDGGITLRGPNSSVQLTDSTIVVSGNAVTITAVDALNVISEKTVEVSGGSSVSVIGGATVQLTSGQKAEIGGPTVKVTASSAPSLQVQSTNINLTNGAIAASAAAVAITATDTAQLSGGKSALVSGRTASVIGGKVVQLTGGIMTGLIGPTVNLRASETVNVQGNDTVKLASGASSLTLRKDGAVALTGKDIDIAGSGQVSVRAEGLSLTSSRLIQEGRVLFLPNDSCIPRRQIGLVVTPRGTEALSVEVSAGRGAIERIEFLAGGTPETKETNALVAVGGAAPRGGDFVHTPPSPISRITFSVLPRPGATGSVTLPLVVTDGCGRWSTIVGSGELRATDVPVGSSLGSFALEPPTSSVSAADLQSLRFAWTLPAPRVWRDLRSLTLRLRDVDETVWAVRWDESSDQFVVTANRQPALFQLAGATSQDSGPTGQSVTLVLPIRAIEEAQGKTYFIEVQAIDDAGAVDPFQPAGALTVLAAAPREKEKAEKLTELERWQRAHTNAGSREDERIEGDVLAVDCQSEPRVIIIGNRDGRVRVDLRRDAARDCRHVRPGQYLEADGEKLTEELFRADRVSAD